MRGKQAKLLRRAAEMVVDESTDLVYNTNYIINRYNTIYINNNNTRYYYKVFKKIYKAEKKRGK